MDLIDEIRKKIVEHRKKNLLKVKVINPFDRNKVLQENEMVTIYKTILGEVERRLKGKREPSGDAPTNTQIANGVIKNYYVTLLNNWEKYKSTQHARELMLLREDGFWNMCTNEFMSEREIELHLLSILNQKEHENKSFEKSDNKQLIIFNEFCKRFVPHSADNITARKITEKIFKNYKNE